MVVAAAYPLAKLGVYSVALTLAMAPSLAVLRVSTSVALPLLSEVQGDAVRFTNRFRLFAQSMAVVGCCITLGMLFCGEQVVVLLFGAKYAGVGALACWLTAAQSLRVLRGAPVCAAMARGDTVNNMVSTLWRLSGLAFAAGVGLLKASLDWFAIAAIAGEIISLLATTTRLSRKHSVPVTMTLAPGTLAAACALVAVGTKAALALPPNSLLNWLVLPIALLTATAAFMACFQELRRYAVSLARHLTARMGASFGNVLRLVPARTSSSRSDPKE
ncbi:MAG: oligosaccharide flippase family protein, partial [Limisphaerales bacterium]